MTLMDLLQKKAQLIEERDKLENAKKEAQKRIVTINSQIRKLEGVIKHAEGFFSDDKKEIQIHPDAAGMHAGMTKIETIKNGGFPEGEQIVGETTMEVDK